jgi:hypothetical protein
MKWRLLFLVGIFSTIAAFSTDGRSKVIELAPALFYIENLYFDCAESQFFTVQAPCEGLFPGERQYSLQERQAYDGKKILKSGTTLFLCEANNAMIGPVGFFLQHAIKIWGLFGENARDDVKTIVLTGSGSSLPISWRGQDKQNFNILSALFPNADIISWQDFKFRAHFGIQQIERAVVSDRLAALRYDTAIKIDKMLAPAASLISRKSVSSFSEAVHNYMGTVPTFSDTLRVTYLMRKEHEISKSVEQNLLERLRSLRFFKLRIADFSQFSFKRQMEVLADTDVLIGGYDPQLSLSLFLPKNSCLIEFFPKESLGLNNRLFANIKGLAYYAISGDEIIDDTVAYQRGVYGDPRQSINDLDVNKLIFLIKLHRAGKMQEKSDGYQYPRVINLPPATSEY